MRSFVATLVCLAACAQLPPPVSPVAPTAPLAPLTSAELATRSHTVLELFDRADVAAFEPLLAERFVHFEGGPPKLRDAELAELRKRTPGAPMFASRSWSDEFTQVGTEDAVFIGKATEVQGGNASHGGYRYTGWYTLHWVRERGAWKLRVWSWQRAGGASVRESWNEIYRNDAGFEKQPNRLLVDVVKGVKPGTALDLATGQGRNALYLAAHGWTVTAIDFADEGLRIARDRAAQAKLELSTINADIDTWDFGKNRFDLVTMIYPGDNHEPWIAKAQAALKPGGLFVLEFFAGDPAMPDDGGYPPGRLAQLFASGFVVLRDDLVEDRPDWARDRARLVRFVAKKR